MTAGNEDKDLVIHQAAAMLFLFETKLGGKTATKLRKILEKELKDLPKEPNGHFQWVSNDSEETDESESSESESSDSEASSSSEDESEGEEESESECECEKDDEGSSSSSDDESEDEDDAKTAKKKKSKSKATKKKIVNPNRGFGRSVSFSEDIEERILSPRKPNLKKKLYYDKNDLRRFKMEHAEEKLKESMAQASATLGVSLAF